MGRIQSLLSEKVEVIARFSLGVLSCQPNALFATLSYELHYVLSLFAFGLIV